MRRGRSCDGNVSRKSSPSGGLRPACAAPRGRRGEVERAVGPPAPALSTKPNSRVAWTRIDSSIAFAGAVVVCRSAAASRRASFVMSSVARPAARPCGSCAALRCAAWRHGFGLRSSRLRVCSVGDVPGDALRRCWLALRRSITRLPCRPASLDAVGSRIPISRHASSTVPDLLADLAAVALADAVGELGRSSARTVSCRGGPRDAELVVAA